MLRTGSAGLRGGSPRRDRLARYARGWWRRQTRARQASSWRGEAIAGSAREKRPRPARYRARRQCPRCGYGPAPARPGSPLRSNKVRCRTDATPGSLPAQKADARTRAGYCDARKRRSGPAWGAGARRIQLPGAVYPAGIAENDRDPSSMVSDARSALLSGHLLHHVYGGAELSVKIAAQTIEDL